MHLLGIDTGGTFTDFVLVADGEVVVRKVPSTPADPARAVLEALADWSPPPVRENLRIVHGSTVATNAILERRGARTALVTTRGFADVLEIGRQDRPGIYDLSWCPPPALVPRALRFEVTERVGPRGEIVIPISDSDLAALPALVRDSAAETVAVCFLFSPENDTHERRVAAALEPLGIPVVASSRVHPELREFERFATTALSAYVAPIVDTYLRRLASGIAPARLFIMESAGGAMAPARLDVRAIRTVLSGPAGGVVAAATLARAHRSDCVSFDMGGTSTDVALFVGGRILHTSSFSIAGFPVATPVVDVHTVGAGGGSQAWIDGGGALRVGPRSSGADPGPICYGRGGTVPTVTDAHFLLGRLPAHARLGGTLRLVDEERVRTAHETLGARLGMPAEAAALGILRVVEAEMERALRRMTQERGIDPRELSLVSFGGAGGLHAVTLARSLGMGTVLVPANPGLFSAAGMLEAPIVETTALAVMAPLSPDLLARIRAELETRERILRDALCVACGDPASVAGVIIERELLLRFRGQSHELTVPWETGGHKRRRAGSADPGAAFLDLYRARYGAVPVGGAIEVTAARSRVLLPAPGNAQAAWRARAAHARSGDRGVRHVPVVAGDGAHRISVRSMARAALSPGERLRGPAIVEDSSSTLWLPAGARLEVCRDGTLRIDPGRFPREAGRKP